MGGGKLGVAHDCQNYGGREVGGGILIRRQNLIDRHKIWVNGGRRNLLTVCSRTASRHGQQNGRSKKKNSNCRILRAPI